MLFFCGSGWGYVFCFPRFKCLQGETALGGGCGTRCFVFRALSVWRGNQCFFLRGVVFSQFKCLEAETVWGLGGLYFVISGFQISVYGKGNCVCFIVGGGWGDYVMCFVFRGLSVWRGKLCHFFLREEGVGELCVFCQINVFGGGNSLLFLRGKGWGDYVFWFPQFKCLEGEAVYFFSAAGERGSMCFGFRGLSVWRRKLCPFFPREGRAMCFVSSDLSVWRGKLCSFFLREGVGQTVCLVVQI